MASPGLCELLPSEEVLLILNDLPDLEKLKINE